MSSYLQDLTLRLAEGVAMLPEETRCRHESWMQAKQCPDGGFPGRDGQSDLYYTGFALRSLFLLGALYGPVAERAGAFLQGRLGGRESIVDLLSLVYGATLLRLTSDFEVFENASDSWRDQMATMFEDLRRDDGGFAKAAEGSVSSTYHSFLILLCLQLIDRPVQQPERLVEFLLSQRSERGGFHEIRAAKRPGTNPTAAAIGALQILGEVDSHIRDDTIDFLADMQTDEGGLRANSRIPIADLLSSFTGAWTLDDLGGVTEIDLRALERYACSLEGQAGGFHGAIWDQERDVEYTFYGLGTLALLARLKAGDQGTDA